MKIQRWFEIPDGKGSAHVEIELTSAERIKAYEEQQHIYDLDDIANELDACSDDLDEKYGTLLSPVTADEKERMARLLRSYLERDPDACWTVCRAQAVTDVLDETRNGCKNGKYNCDDCCRNGDCPDQGDDGEPRWKEDGE